MNEKNKSTNFKYLNKINENNDYLLEKETKIRPCSDRNVQRIKKLHTESNRHQREGQTYKVSFGLCAFIW